jgi:hypothetical protein
MNAKDMVALDHDLDAWRGYSSLLERLIGDVMLRALPSPGIGRTVHIDQAEIDDLCFLSRQLRVRSQAAEANFLELQHQVLHPEGGDA